MSVFKEDQTTYTGNVTVLGSLNVSGNLGVTGTITAATINGIPVPLTTITNSIGADVILNNTANYFDGPSIAQGTTGTWFASGTLTLFSTNVDNIGAKLWDGTTVVSSAITSTQAGLSTTISLSGYIASPVANLKISARDFSSTAGKIVFNSTGSSKDSTISAIRIG